LTKKIDPPSSWNITSKCEREEYEKRWKGNQRRIGITGGIASGKSTISNYLEQIKELPILDADIFAHEILTPGSKVSNTVIGHFGKKIILKNRLKEKVIDRAALAELIFSNKNDRFWLEELIHPIIKVRINKELQKLSNRKTIILVIPLLFEAKFTEICSEVWLAYCSLETQISRLMKRNKLSRKQAMKRINAQLPLEAKREFSDVIIDNNKLQNLEKQIEAFL